MNSNYVYIFLKSVIYIAAADSDGLRQIFLTRLTVMLLVDIRELRQTRGDDGGGAVAAGVFGRPRVRLPRDAAKERRFMFGAPLRPYPIRVHLPRLVQIERPARRLVHAYLGEHNPFHVIDKDVPPRILLAFAEIEPRGTFPPLVEQSEILVIMRPQIGVHDDVHGVGLRPVTVGGHVRLMAFLVEIESVGCLLEACAPEVFDERGHHAVRLFVPVMGVFLRVGVEAEKQTCNQQNTFYHVRSSLFPA